MILGILENKILGNKNSWKIKFLENKILGK
jgi:hypothetical protein